MTPINNLSEAETFLEDVLGKEATQIFDRNLEELLCFIRASALGDSMDDEEMKQKIVQISEGILAASVKKYLDDNFADEDGILQVNVGNGMVYDKDMNPIEAVRKISTCQGDIMSLLVSRGMYEFAKGRHLLTAIASKAVPKVLGASIEGLESEVSKIEAKLPNLSADEGSRLVSLYSEIRSKKARPF